MPARNRSAGRDVHLYDMKDPSEVLGGLILTNGVTNANFHTMVETIFIFQSPYDLQNEDKTSVSKDSNPLRPGNYYIVSADSFAINNEVFLVRTISHYTGTRVKAFRDAVRSRDGRCIISGKRAVNADLGLWAGFEAAHIFPLAYESHWNEHHLSRWITNPPATGGSINSVHNGLLLRADLHQLFDNYALSINPDDNYKIVFFVRDDENLAGNYLDQRFLNNPDRPVDQLLRWHFRQAVLGNMRGAGVPIFEHDFPAGCDMMGEIIEGPMAASRMEFELFDRLASFSDR